MILKQEMAIKMDYYCHEVAESVSQPQSKSIELQTLLWCFEDCHNVGSFFEDCNNFGKVIGDQPA